jgi:UDPglucose 6-dehydrogenase
VVDRLEKEGAVIRAHDPIAIADAQAIKPHLIYCQDPYEAVRHAEALLILTEWPSFKDLDYREIKAQMAQPNIVDPWNLLDGKALRSLGFNYEGMGRP